MEMLADSWMVWLILAVVVVMIVSFYRQSRSGEVHLITSADEFSIKTVLLNPRKGEGDLFIGFVLSMIFFCMSILGFLRWIRTIY